MPRYTYLIIGGGMTADAAVQARMAEHFRLAERLGAEVATLSGQDIATTLLEYARSRNVTKILIGKTEQPRWRRLLFGSVVDDLLEQSGDIDVYVVRGEGEPVRPPPAPSATKPRSKRCTLSFPACSNRKRRH